MRLHAEEPAHATLAALCGLLTAVAAAPNADVFLHSSGLVPAALQGLGEAIGADDLELVGPMMRCAAAVVSGLPHHRHAAAADRKGGIAVRRVLLLV